MHGRRRDSNCARQHAGYGHRSQRSLGRIPPRRRRPLYRRRARHAQCRRRRIRRHRGADRLWQIHAAQHRRRADRAVVRQRRYLRQPAGRAQPSGRLSVPGRRAVSLEDGTGKRRHRAGTAGTPTVEAGAGAPSWPMRVGLSAFGDRYPHMLSGGQRKRVGLAQVLIRDPKILLMDEPFGPLDAQTRQIMGNLLLDLWSADRKAVLFVTHDLEEAIALADRVVIMSAGPSARIIGDWRVSLPRPRDIFEVRLDKEFHALHREIWSVLRDEVLKGYAQTEGG